MRCLLGSLKLLTREVQRGGLWLSEEDGRQEMPERCERRLRLPPRAGGQHRLRHPHIQGVGSTEV